MNIIPSNCFNEQNLSTSINKFFKTFQLSSILAICNCKNLSCYENNLFTFLIIWDIMSLKKNTDVLVIFYGCYFCKRLYG